MGEERTVVENLGRRRLIREYAADGTLRLLRLEPVPPSAPPVASSPPRPLAPVEPARAPPAPAPPPPPPPAPAPEPARAPPAQPPSPPAPPPEPAQLSPPAPEPETLPVELEPYEEPAMAPASSTPLAHALDAASETLAPARFEILAVHAIADEPPARVEAPPEPAPIAAAAAPAEPIIAPPVEVEPIVVKHASPTVLRPRARAVSLVRIRLAPHVPDLEKRVDALLARKPRVEKKRPTRAHIEVPRFAPLKRSAWEDRLDAVLRERGEP